ncbi:uncharacterized protein LOC131144791 [Malania oleifera]|uniref:uncharacterized protein LOC131144791 n=1 Tax=Malania oleifera TaxID=397392 RepID=UPI0025ADBBAE|nr:uncharacterized protein LOC131144791 [Malania oleifera]
MCNAKTRSPTTSSVDGINCRPVLQSACNRVAGVDRRRHFPINKLSPKSPSTAAAPPISPKKSKSPRGAGPQGVKKRGGSDVNGLNTSAERVSITTTAAPKTLASSLERKKSKRSGVSCSVGETASFTYSSSLIVEAPGTIAAVRREQVALQQAQRKMRIAHYGRTKSGKSLDSNVNVNVPAAATATAAGEEKRCGFITSNSDPLYVAYHDQEWGVPVHDDKMLFELLVLCGAQVGSDWTSILKKREDFRKAFSGFDAEIVANFREKQITSVSAEYGIDLSRVRGVVDNSNRILVIKKELGSLDKYVWGFVNHKPISTQYKAWHKIPAKTSKSESISKDMVRRGFRFVGPTVVHSFMQAAGLTNDHLISCHRHLHCTAPPPPAS